MNAGLAAIGVLWRRDLYHFVREPMRVVASVAQPLLFWLLLGHGLYMQATSDFRPATG